MIAGVDTCCTGTTAARAPPVFGGASTFRAPGNEVPQSPQKTAARAFALPHFAQDFDVLTGGTAFVAPTPSAGAIFVPHPLQNLAVSTLSNPQLWQAMPIERTIFVPQPLQNFAVTALSKLQD